ncbi:MAG: sterol desaturase family protein [Nannocystaceae bacterium]|nr:sterol desaturase family protein [Nannocystaceae bacterium]
MGERWIFTAVVWGAHELAFFATWALFGLCFRLGVARRFQVADGKGPPPELARKAVGEVLRGHALLLPVTAFAIYPAWSAMGGTIGGAWPGAFEIAWQLLACILIQDTMFYWSHRALHLPRLYKAIHVKHHTFRHVRGHASEYAHPLEVFANLVSFMAPAIVLHLHLGVFGLWVLLRTFETVEAHSGYALSRIASRHAFHHLYAAKGCLGSFFGVWDRLMGTDRQWRQWRREQSHR